MTETVTKIKPCVNNMLGQPIDTTCPDCRHSAFVHMIEADGCVLCHVDSTRDDIREMLEEMREIISSFTVTSRMNTPRAGSRRGKLTKKQR